MMKIVNINCMEIVFDNGNYITCSHTQDGFECNYADFEQLDNIVKSFDFEENLIFTEFDGGFKFGNDVSNMISVPCYSIQTGKSDISIDIYYNKCKVLSTNCKEIIYN